MLPAAVLALLAIGFPTVVFVKIRTQRQALGKSPVILGTTPGWQGMGVRGGSMKRGARASRGEGAAGRSGELEAGRAACPAWLAYTSVGRRAAPLATLT